MCLDPLVPYQPTHLNTTTSDDDSSDVNDGVDAAGDGASV